MKDEEAIALLKSDLQRAKEARRPKAWIRPVFLVVAYMLASYTLLFLDSASRVNVSSIPLSLIRGVVTELRVDLNIAAIFWFFFRAHYVSNAENSAILFCLICSLLIEWIFHPYISGSSTLIGWALIYRYLYVAILFWISHRFFRLSIQPMSLNESTRSLNLRNLLFAIFLLAILMALDRWFRANGQNSRPMLEWSDPPWLALAFAISRASLWVGLALTLTRSGRPVLLLGCFCLTFWLIARSAIVLYLSQVLYPNMASRIAGASSLPTLEELGMIQIVQLLFALTAILSILTVGYRFRAGPADGASNQTNENSTSFDSIT